MEPDPFAPRPAAGHPDPRRLTWCGWAIVVWGAISALYALALLGAVVFADRLPSTARAQSLEAAQLDERFGLVMAAVLFGSGALTGAVAIAGGVALIRRRAPVLAVLGAIALPARLDICCCAPGLAIATWALIELFAFRGVDALGRRGAVAPPRSFEGP